MPYIIFKAKKDSIINNDLKKYIKERKFNIITTTQNNAWIDEEIFINYIETILSKYKAGTKKLLIMDYCTAHCTDKIFETLKNKNIDYIFIPKHMTPVLQPLDRMVNFPFKKYLKTKFSEYLMFANEKEESIGEARKRILNDINEIWFDNSNKYSGINADNIIKSFKITGISNNMDGTEDSIFDGYNVINKLSETKERNSDSDSGYDTDKEKKKKNTIVTKIENKDKEKQKLNNINDKINDNIENNTSNDKINIEKNKNENEDILEDEIKNFINTNDVEEDFTELFDILEIDKE